MKGSSKLSPEQPADSYIKNSIFSLWFHYNIGSDMLYKKTPPVCTAKFKYSYLKYAKEDGYSHPIMQY